LADDLEFVNLELRTPVESTCWWLLAASYPVWGLGGPLLLVGTHELHDPISATVRWALIAVYSSLLYFALHLRRKVASFALYPPGCDQAEISKLRRTKFLKGILLSSRQPRGEQQLVLQFRQNQKMVEQEIDLSLIDNARAAAILNAINRSATDCQCTADARALLTSRKAVAINPEKVTINYLPNQIQRQAFDVSSEARAALNGIWSNTCTTCTILIIPVLVSMALWGEHSSQGKNLWVVLGILDFPALLVLAAFTCISGGAVIAASFAAQNIISQIIVLLLLTLALFKIVPVFCTPNALVADAIGLKTVMKLGRWRRVISQIKWKNLNSIQIIRSANSTDPAKWNIQFVCEDSRALNLTLGGLLSSHDKLKLLKSIDRFAPQVVRHSELQTCLQPAINQSYTDLWLEALTQPPKREQLLPLKAGHLLKDGEYVIHSLFGSGGQGVTYLAASASSIEGELLEAGCKLIVKESMLPLYVSEETRRVAVEHFHNDAQLLRDLKSEQIAQLHDYFIEDHRRYLVLERVFGTNLRSMIEADGAMSSIEVLKLIPQIIKPLQYIQNRTPPVVHRDFTPDNLIFSRDGNLVLIDFDVASDSNNKTLATIVGKQSYIPPEQLRGQFEPASDIYALGATLYFLATGADPTPLSKSTLPPLNGANLADDMLLKGSYEQLNQIIEGCTSLDVAKRFSLEEIKILLENNSRWQLSVGPNDG